MTISIVVSIVHCDNHVLPYTRNIDVVFTYDSLLDINQ